MADTTRFPDGGINIEQAAGLPATGVQYSLETYLGTLYYWTGVAWVAMAGTLGTAQASSDETAGTIANTTTAGVFAPVTIPAAKLQAGATGRISLGGSWGRTGTPELVVSLVVEGVVLLSRTISPNLDGEWSISADLYVDAVGAVKLRTEILTRLGTADAATSYAAVQSSPTGDLSIQAGAQWGTANASNSITSVYSTVTMFPPSAP